MVQYSAQSKRGHRRGYFLVNNMLDIVDPCFDEFRSYPVKNNMIRAEKELASTA